MHASHTNHTEQGQDSAAGTQIVLSQSRSAGGMKSDSIGINYDLTSPDGERVKGLFFFHPLQPYTVKMKPKWDDVSGTESNTENFDEDITSCTVSIHQIMHGKQVYEALNVELHPDDAALFHEQVCDFIEPIVGRAFQGVSTRRQIESPSTPKPRAQAQQLPGKGSSNAKVSENTDASVTQNAAAAVRTEQKTSSTLLPWLLGGAIMVGMVLAAGGYRMMTSNTSPSAITAPHAPTPTQQGTAMPFTATQPQPIEQREQPWTPN